MTGGDALVEVLNGTVNPSGKLTDTWAVDYNDYPSSATFSWNDAVHKDGESAGLLHDFSVCMEPKQINMIS